MTWLYATEITLTVTAVILMPAMKRAGDESWRHHCTMRRWRGAVARTSALLDGLAEVMRDLEAAADHVVASYRGPSANLVWVDEEED